MPGCLLPALFAAGMPSPQDLGLPAPGPRIGISAPTTLKEVYGTPLPLRHDTDNFSIQWQSPAISESAAQSVGVYMEESWAGLVEEEGWLAPASSDSYLLTVILDPDLGGTGLTLTVEDEMYPEGVPVIYIHPEWVSTPDFMASLCAHEFAHALQFAVRDWYSGADHESWYWEASAEWQAELAQPELDVYAWTSQYYASAPHADFHSMASYHQYGMFLLNAYLDEYVLGSDGFRDVWQSNVGMPWTDELEEAVGEPAADIWAAFSAAYGTGQLRESAIYNEPLIATGETVLSGWLGTHYIMLGDVSGVVSLDAGVGAVSRGEGWTVFEGEAEVPAGAGDVWLMVVNPDPEPLSYRVVVGDLGDLDTGEPMDEGEDVSGPQVELSDVNDPSKGCRCSAGRGTRIAGRGTGMVWLLLPLLVWRRRASTR